MATYDVTTSPYNAKGDMQSISDGVMTIGSGILTTVSSTPFTSADAGKTVYVAGAGSGGTALLATILSYQSNGQVTLGTAAGASVSGAYVDWGTDNGTAIQSALDDAQSAGGGTVYIPEGIYLLRTTKGGHSAFLYPGPGVAVCGDGSGSVLKAIGGLASAFRFFAWSSDEQTGSLDHFTLRDLVFDHNGQNNTFGSGGVSSTNCASLYADAFNDILIENVAIQHNAGRQCVSLGNNIHFGGRVRINNVVVDSVGAYFDPDQTDHSSFYIMADDVVVENCTLRNPYVDPADFTLGWGTAFEIHSQNWTVCNNRVYNFKTGMNIVSTHVNCNTGYVYGNTFKVSRIGFSFWQVKDLKLSGIFIHDNRLELLGRGVVYGFDLRSNIDDSATTGLIQIHNNRIICSGVKTNDSNSVNNMCVRIKQISHLSFRDNYIQGFESRVLGLDKIATGSIFELEGNEIVDCATTAFSNGSYRQIFSFLTTGAVASNISIRSNNVHPPNAALPVGTVAGDGSLVKVTTAQPHGLSTGDTVFITGVTGTGSVPNANGGPWTITVVSATDIDLQSSTFSSGSYTSGGTVYIIPAAGVGISGATNNGAGLIRLTTTPPNGLATGDLVLVAGVNGAPAANGGPWAVIAVSAGTTLDLQGSAFSGTYTSGGTLYKIPGSGVAISAAANAGGAVKLTTALPHGLSTNDRVMVAGVLGLSGTGPNGGPWSVTVLDYVTLLIQGTSYAGSYTGGGIVYISDAYVSGGAPYLNGTGALAIVGAADNGSGLIRLATAQAHGLGVGNSVLVAGVQGTTEANGGPWVVAALTSTTLDLQSSAFVNSYTSGGILFTTSGGAAAVSATASLGGLIQLTTAQPHGFTPGVSNYPVLVAGVQGTIEANGGSWQATIPSAPPAPTTLSLGSSAYSHSYTGGGFIYPAQYLVNGAHSVSVLTIEDNMAPSCLILWDGSVSIASCSVRNVASFPPRLVTANSELARATSLMGQWVDTTSGYRFVKKLDPSGSITSTLPINASTKSYWCLEVYGSAAPVTGYWNLGDIVYSASPASGGQLGWICTTGGNPGTWKAFGAIS